MERYARWALRLSGTATVLLASQAWHLEVVRLLCDPMQLYMQLYLLVFAPMELEFVETDTRGALHLSGTAPVLLASRAWHLEVVRLLCDRMHLFM